ISARRTRDRRFRPDTLMRGSLLEGSSLTRAKRTPPHPRNIHRIFRSIFNRRGFESLVASIIPVRLRARSDRFRRPLRRVRSSYLVLVCLSEGFLRVFPAPEGARAHSVRPAPPGSTLEVLGTPLLGDRSPHQRFPRAQNHRIPLYFAPVRT